MQNSIVLLVVALFAGWSQSYAAGFCDVRRTSPEAKIQGRSDDTGLSSVSEEIRNTLKYDEQARAQIMCSIREAILNKYSLVELKRDRLKLDVAGFLEGCAQQELKIGDGDPLAFTDRARKCIAGLQDTHLSLDTQGGVANVFVGVLLKEVDGKFYISSTYPDLISYLETTNGLDGLAEKLAVGNEVLEVDGKNPADLVTEYAQYENGSSEEYRRMSATISILSRGFRYPDKNTVLLKVKVSDEETVTVRLPWWVQTEGDRPDVDLYLEQKKIKPVKDVTWTYKDNPNVPIKEWVSADLKRTGWSYGNPIVPKAERGLLTTYLSEGAPALRTGVFTPKQGKSLCYMQLMTFMADKLTDVADASKREQDFFEVVRSFASSCEDKELPLILDLRLNGGGRGDYPPQLLSVFTEKEKEYPSSLSGFRRTAHTSWLVTRLAKFDSAAKYMQEFDDGTLLLDALEKVQGTDDKHLPILSSPAVKADSEVGGFSGKIVVLVTPFCVSACDITANLFHTSRRATLLGTPANGTGAGYISTEGFDSNWNDSYDMFKLHIPNFLFGVAAKPTQEPMLDFEANKGLLMENQPTPVDVKYETTLEDFTNNSQGWYKAAVKELFK